MKNIKFNNSIAMDCFQDFDDEKEIIEHGKAYIKLDYPLCRTVMFQFNDVWTKASLFLHIQEAYKHIYDNEDFYQIWGHVFEDLYLEGVEYSNGVFELIVGS